MNLGFREDFADEVDWSLHSEGMAFLLAFVVEPPGLT
jgi:hypothetical protein